MAKKKVAAKSATKKRLTAEQFVTAFKAVKDKNGSVSDLAEKLGISKVSVSQKIAAYRKEGVKLPRLARKPKLDVEGLNAILASKI